MQNRAMHADFPAIPQRLFRRAEKPFPEFLAPLLRLNLLVVLDVVNDHQPRPLAVPLPSANFLFPAARHNPERVPVFHATYDIGLGVRVEFLDPERSNQFLVLAQFVRNVAQVLDRHFLA